MWYFEYPVEIDNKGIRISDPDHITEFTPEYMFEKHAWLLGSTFSYEEHPKGGLYLRRLSGEDFKDKGP
jgi:hypothetical protein